MVLGRWQPTPVPCATSVPALLKADLEAGRGVGGGGCVDWTRRAERGQQTLVSRGGSSRFWQRQIAGAAVWRLVKRAKMDCAAVVRPLLSGPCLEGCVEDIGRQLGTVMYLSTRGSCWLGCLELLNIWLIGINGVDLLPTLPDFECATFPIPPPPHPLFLNCKFRIRMIVPSLYVTCKISEGRARIQDRDYESFPRNYCD